MQNKENNSKKFRDSQKLPRRNDRIVVVDKNKNSFWNPKKIEYTIKEQYPDNIRD